MKRAYFQYYETFENILEAFDDLEVREHFRKFIINYGLHGVEPADEMSQSERVAWIVCKDLIDQQVRRRETNAQNAKAKPKPRDQKPQEEPKPKRETFKAPTLEEVRAEISAKGYRVSAEKFFNYYESNGWHVGRQKMKNWNAALAKWNAEEFNKTGNVYQSGTDSSADYSNKFN